MNRILRKVLGEGDAQEKGIIPGDAKPLDTTLDIVGKPIAPITRVVQEPSRPAGDKEKYLTPYAALTAPDCTPDAMQPIDPSKVPGGSGPERFTAHDLEQADQPSQTGLGGRDAAVQAMEVLLGKGHLGSPARDRQQMAAAGRMTTEEAEAMIAGATPLTEAAAAKAKEFATTALLPAQDGGAMPEPTVPGDGRRVFEAARRFI